MTAARLRKLSALLTTLSVTSLGIYQVRDGIDQSWPLSDLAWRIVLWGSLTLLLVALLMFIAASTRFDWARTIYVCLRIERSQIPAYYRFIQQTLGEDVAPQPRVFEWFDKNPEVLRAVYRETARGPSFRRDLIGFFAVFPVTRNCAQLLAQNQIKGTALSADQIISRGRRPAALYIGAIGAPTWRARQQTVLALMGYVSAWLDRNIPLYTRPTTKEGRIIALKHRFVPIDPAAPLGESVYVRDERH